MTKKGVKSKKNEENEETKKKKGGNPKIKKGQLFHEFISLTSILGNHTSIDRS